VNVPISALSSTLRSPYAAIATELQASRLRGQELKRARDDAFARVGELEHQPDLRQLIDEASPLRELNAMLRAEITGPQRDYEDSKQDGDQLRAQLRVGQHPRRGVLCAADPGAAVACGGGGVAAHPVVGSGISGPRTMAQLTSLLAVADLDLDANVLDRSTRSCRREPPSTGPTRDLSYRSPWRTRACVDAAASASSDSRPHVTLVAHSSWRHSAWSTCRCCRGPAKSAELIVNVWARGQSAPMTPWLHAAPHRWPRRQE
jgi:hypothetical protein